MFSAREYADIVFVYGFCDGNGRAAVIEYRRRFPQRVVPDHRVFARSYNRLANGTIFNRLEAGRVERRNVRENEDIINLFRRDPGISTRRAALRLGVPKTRILKVLRNENFHPYHFSKVQELLPQDYGRRVEFCTWLQDNDVNEMFFSSILWTDESQFTKIGCLNLHNSHHWSDTNPRRRKIASTQHRFSVNVWAGIIGNVILGKHF
jgi:hypothetical protein